MKRLTPLITATLALLLLVASPAAGAAQPAGVRSATADAAAANSTLFVTMGEMYIHTIPVARAGNVTFNVKNVGTEIHEVVVIRTNLPDGALPADPAEPGKVVETGSIGETGDVAAGATAQVTLTLTPGTYALICNQPGHYAAGMHTMLVVASYVDLTLDEMTITSNVTSVPAGRVIFGAANVGKVVHEVVVIRTNTPFDQLPADPAEAGKVMETGSVGETGDIAAGAWGSVIVDLSPGSYALICNQPGHYGAGMRMAFTVK